MARKPKNGKSGPTETVATTLLLPPKKTISDLAESYINMKKRTSSSRGSYGKQVASAVEEKHLDKGALSLVLKLHNMDDERLHVTYFHFLRYMDDLGIPNRAKAQEELFNAEETGPGVKSRDKDGDEAVAGADNVTHIGTAARKVAEAAGEAATGS